MLLGFTFLLMLSYPCHFPGFNSHTVVRGSVLGSVIFPFPNLFLSVGSCMGLLNLVRDCLLLLHFPIWGSTKVCLKGSQEAQGRSFVYTKVFRCKVNFSNCVEWTRKSWGLHGFPSVFRTGSKVAPCKQVR